MFVACRATAISGRDMRLPDDLPDGPVLVLVGFSPDAQPDMDRWIAAASEERLSVVEVPVILDPIGRAFSGVLAHRMRARTPPKDHEHVLIVTRDAAAVAEWVGQHDDDRAYVYLLDEGRRVIQSWAGDIGGGEIAAISTLVDAAAPRDSQALVVDQPQ